MSLEDEKTKLRHMSDSAIDKTMKKMSMSSNAKEFVPKNRITRDDLVITSCDVDSKFEQVLTDVLNDDKHTGLDYTFTDAGYESHFSCGNVSECAVNEGDMCLGDDVYSVNVPQMVATRPTSLQVNTLADTTVYHPLNIHNPSLFTMEHVAAPLGIYSTQAPSVAYTHIIGQDSNNYVSAPVLQASSPPMVIQHTGPPGIGVYRSYHNSEGSSPHSYQSISPPIITATNNGSSSTINGEHYVMVHVNLGETFSIRVGDQIQNITGPATVRMVSNSGPPTPMPMQVPPGHMVQQIVDENGILTHVILSPLHQPNQCMAPHVQNIHASNNQSTFYPSGQNNNSLPMYQNCYSSYTNASNISQTNNMNKCPGVVATVNSNADNGFQDQANESRTVNRVSKEKSNHTDYNLRSINNHIETKPRPMKPRIHQYHHPSQNEDSSHYVKSRSSHVVSSLGSNSITTDSTHQQDKSANSCGYSNHSHYSKIRKKRPFLSSTSANTKHHYVQDQASSPASSADEATTVLTDEEKKAIRDVLNNMELPEVSEIEAHSALIHIITPTVPDNCIATINPADFTFQLHFAERNPDSRYNCVFYGEAVEISLQDLKPATVYYVKVCCIYENIIGNLSAASKFTTAPSEPGTPKPAQLQSKSRNSVQLKWISPIENGSKIIDYIVEYCRVDHVNDNFLFGYRGDTKACKISKLKPSTEYLFRLAAVNTLGQSPWSDLLSVTTSGTAPLPPDPPIVARADIGGLLLTWKRRSTDDTFCLEMMDEATGYGFITVFNGPEIEHYVENLRRNTSYRFHLAASNYDGRSKWSDVVTISTKPDLPSHPLKFHTRGKICSTTFVLVWDPPEDDGGLPVTSYKLELDITTTDIIDCCGSDRDWLTAYEGQEREYQCKSMVPGSSVLARVSAKSSNGGWGRSCNPITVTLAATVPGQMSPPRRDIGNKLKAGMFTPGTVNLLWEKPDNDGGSPIINYELCQWLLKSKSKPLESLNSNSIVVTDESECEEYEEQIVNNGSQLHCQIIGLIPGAQYRYRIRATNKAGNGKWSSRQDITSGPSAPEGPSEAPTVLCQSPHSAMVSWLPPVQANGSQITEYRLEMKHKSDLNADFQLVYNGSNLSYDIKSLQPDSVYRFRVQAINIAGISPFSPVSEVTTPPFVPCQVTNVRINTITMHSIQLLWKEPLCNGSVINNYLIEVTSGNVSSMVDTVSSEVCDSIIGDLLPDTNYKFRVQAINGVGPGAFSTTVKASTLSAPPAPPKLECLNVQSSSIKLRWHTDISSRQYYINRRLGKQNVLDRSRDLPISHNSSELSINQYQLQMSRQSYTGWSNVYTGSLQSHKLGKLIESTRYYFRIMASNSMGDGDYSDPYLIVTEKAAPAQVRAPRVVELSVDSCTIEWPPIRSMNYDPIVYILQLLIVSEKDCDYRQVYRGSDTTCQLKSLISGTEYMVRVCAVRLCSPATIESERNSDSSPIHTHKTIHELGKTEKVSAKSNDNSSPVTELLGAFSKSVAFITCSGHNPASTTTVNPAKASLNCDKCPGSVIQIPHIVSRCLANLGPWNDNHAIILILCLFTVFVIVMAKLLQSYVK